MRSIRRIARILLVIVLIIGVPWLLLEVVMRVAFDALPPGVQAQIQQVRRVPWAEEKILPPLPVIADTSYQERLPVGLTNYPVRWSDARFTFDTISAWDGHVAGLRSAKPVYPLDIMTFGDSHTFCWVKWEACWVNQLSSKQGWNVFNAAIPGTGAYGQLNLMKELVPPMKPRLVVWVWFANDVSDDYDLSLWRKETEERNGAPYPDPESAPTGLASISAVAALVNNRLNPPPKISPYQHYQLVTLNNRPYSVHTNEYPHPYTLSWANNQFGIEINRRSHEESIKALEATGTKILFVYLPVKEEAYAQQLTPLLGADYLTAISEPRRSLIQQCETNGWTCLDTTDALQAATLQGQTVFYSYDSHLDESGNALLSDLVIKAITDQGLLKSE